jgi:Secretion system C-terminal sorting domain
MLAPDSLYAPIDQLQSEISVKLIEAAALIDSSDMSNEQNRLIVGSKYNDAYSQEQQILNQSEKVDAHRLPKLQNVLLQMQNLPALNAYEQNRRWMNIFEIRRAMGENIDDQSTLDDLRNIAAQSYETGGSSIFEARRFLPDQERSQYPEITDKLPNSGNREGEQLSEVYLSGGWTIFPNPVEDDELFLKSPVDLNNAKWEIVDQLGRIFVTGQLGDGTDIYSIHPGNLAPGIYVLKVNHNDGAKSLKFVKQ